jgi:hypothetical protein
VVYGKYKLPFIISTTGLIPQNKNKTRPIEHMLNENDRIKWKL